MNVRYIMNVVHHVEQGRLPEPEVSESPLGHLICLWSQLHA